ncbi:carbohydrate-binding module family 13 protein [Rhizophagus clarus]|uniref:Carbohydrate-binding module family 13 protein n=1 Tax=Rhizophagus clarus TaxID=94130 RepID=A0A8H3MEC9_9GLOM|nr:carbohydrate-binding module family 13 protein [Rhizophagus clarus]
MMYNNMFLPKLSQNLLEILDDNEYYDITIEVGNDPYKYDGILTHIKLPNIPPEIFQTILRYIYGGKLFLEEHNTSDIIKILIVASKLGLQELINHLQSFLIEIKKNWIEQNFSLIYQISFKDNSFLKLQDFCMELISKEPEKIFNSIDFISISEKCLISLIKRDNIQMDDIKIWEHVLKWGIAQNPELPSDHSNYSKDDFNILKNTLQRLIPFIKFFNLNNKEFLNKVYPYKRIIPKDLRESLIKHYIDHDNSEPNMIEEINSKSIDSKIITTQHVELISKWIDRLKATEKTYEFKLIFRGSRDGFSPSKFHEICDNKFRTISIIKVKDSNEILGGYNPNGWKSLYSYSTTKDSFIFSFKNKDNIKNFILSRVKIENCAIFNSHSCGPSFGADLVMHGNDFYNRSYCKGCICYREPIRQTEKQFSVEEYEIFQIMEH